MTSTEPEAQTEANSSQNQNAHRQARPPSHPRASPPPRPHRLHGSRQVHHRPPPRRPPQLDLPRPRRPPRSPHRATIPQLFERHGEAHFRRLESTALASALGQNNTILALGGGTPEELTNRLLLEQTPATFTIFLDAPFPTLFDRCMLQDIARPVLEDPAAAQLRFAKRHPLYRRLANLTIDTADLTPDQTIEAILSRPQLAPRLIPEQRGTKLTKPANSPKTQSPHSRS